MDKRGLTLKFLVTLLLALIVFAPACAFVTKFLRVSEQAHEDFIQLARELEEIWNEQEVGFRTTELVILDLETAVVYFEKEKPNMTVFIDGIGGNDWELAFLKPKECTNEKPCLCLFQEVEPRRTVLASVRKGEITGTTFCKESVPIKMESCTKGIDEGARSYHCSNGFLLERNVMKKANAVAIDITLDVHRELDRRTTLQIEKKEDHILIQ